MQTVPEPEPATETRAGREPTATDYRVGMAEDVEIRDHISALVETERSLRDRLASGEITTQEEHERLRRVETELDQCWDLLRQRDALRSAGADPSQAEPRSPDVVEKYIG